MIIRWLHRFWSVVTCVVVSHGAPCLGGVIVVEQSGRLETFGESSLGGVLGLLQEDLPSSGPFDVTLATAVADAVGSMGSMSSRMSFASTDSSLTVASSVFSEARIGLDPAFTFNDFSASADGFLLFNFEVSEAFSYRLSTTHTGDGLFGYSAWARLFRGADFEAIVFNHIIDSLHNPIFNFSDSGVLLPGSYSVLFSHGVGASVVQFAGIASPLFSAVEGLMLLELFPISTILTVMEGFVRVRRASGEEIEVAAAAPLFQGDTIITGSSDRAEVTFRDGSVVRLGPNAEFVLQSDTEGETIIDLLRGLLDSVIDSPTGRRWQIRTPTHGGSVRGTEFSTSYVELAGFGTTTFDVDSGLVDITDLQTGELITTLEAGDHFSATVPLAKAVPEPSGIVLLSIGGLGLAAASGWKRRPRCRQPTARIAL